MAGATTTVLARARSRLSLWGLAIGVGLRRRARAEWQAAPPHLWRLGRPAAEGFAAAPRDPRPLTAASGQDVLAGVFALGGLTLRLPPSGDPWNQASPSRGFAARLHRFDWLEDLLATGDAGARESLRLTLEWRRVFGRPNRFTWSPNILERRVFNLACAGRAMAAVASDAEAARLSDVLARQARQLVWLSTDPERRAERLAAAAVAGAALSGAAGERLMATALARLGPALDRTVLPDGGHATRSPQAGLELLFDLLALDDGLTQRGRAPPESLSRAIDRLTSGLRFFTLADGRLACFQGGETSTAARVAAARAHEDAAAAPTSPLREAPYAGYQRMDGPIIQVIADAGAAAAGSLGLTACGQPLAIEVVCGRDRLITNCGWSPQVAETGAIGTDAPRLAAAGSTATVGAANRGGAAGSPLTGFLRRALGPRLEGGPARVIVHRRENEAGVWVEMEHDGWVARHGLTHERRLFLDRTGGELRGEDRFVPVSGAPERLMPVDIHFHLHPDANASLARDQRSVLLRGASNVGWWLRNDAAEVSIEPSVHFEDGQPRRCSQVVLRGRLRADKGGRVRWKLALVEPASA